MIRTPRYRIEAFIKKKGDFSIPMIQTELGLDYGEIREIISDLVDEEKVVLLGGILYKWILFEEENNDNGDDKKDTTPSWLDNFFKDDDDDDDDDADDDNDENDSTDSWLDNLLKDDDDDEDDSEQKDDSSLSFDDFLKAIMSTNTIDIGDPFKKDTDWNFGDINKLTKSNGGPLPEIDDKLIPLSHLMMKQRDYDRLDNTFLPVTCISLPDKSDPLKIHVSKADDGELDSYLHDNGQFIEYVRSLADGLEDDVANGWQKLIERLITGLDLNGRYEDGRFKYYVTEYMTYEAFNHSLAGFIIDIMEGVNLVNAIIKGYRETASNDDVDRYDLAEHILKTDISFESIPEFVDKVRELKPKANADTINRLFLVCAMSAIRERHPKKIQIMDLSKKGRANSGATPAIHLIMKDIKRILESKDGDGE